ncbi:MAG: hypothetical protein WA651_13430 [Candidatus Sulfotelmatobacter sp.]
MSEPIDGVKPVIDEPFYYSECDLPASELLRRALKAMLKEQK